MKRLLLVILCCWLCLQGGLCAAVEQPELSEPDKRALLASLYEADIPSVREAIDRRFLTCEEVTAYCLERIEAYDESYNCFITLCDDALEVARQRDAQLAAGEGDGALFGIPVVVKDNIHYAGYPTTNGRSSRLDDVSKENAEIVDYLLAEGAVILGKTNMSTDAQDARASRSGAAGETKNAYNHHLASGGSSGGSAVAVSLNFALAGLGTDTNSSLRYPAALSGCVALRPTAGLLSRKGVVRLNAKRDVPGVITRTVYDQAIMLDVISGGEHRYAENLDASALEGLRIGVLKEFAYPNKNEWQRDGEDLDDEIEAAFAEAVEELRGCGAEVVEVSFPKLFSLSEVTFEHDSKTSREKFYAAYQKLLTDNEISAVIFPTYLHAPHYSGEDEHGVEWDVYEQPYITNCRNLASCMGIPEITVPIGRHSRGAGIGMEIAGDKETEQLLLNIAYAYTERFDHRVAPSRVPELRSDAYGGSLVQRMAAYDAAVLAAEEARLRAEEAAAKAEEEAAKQLPETEEVPGAEQTPDETSAIWIGAAGLLGVGAALGGGIYYYNMYQKKREEAPASEGKGSDGE